MPCSSPVGGQTYIFTSIEGHTSQDHWTIRLALSHLNGYCRLLRLAQIQWPGRKPAVWHWSTTSHRTQTMTWNIYFYIDNVCSKKVQTNKTEEGRKKIRSRYRHTHTHTHRRSWKKIGFMIQGHESHYFSSTHRQWE